MDKRAQHSKKLGNLIKLIREQRELIDSSDYIYVFGSYAIGSETKESDIDLLFISSNKKLIVGVIRELSILLNTSKI